MAKITSKASLVAGTNVKFHIADKGGTDIAIADDGDGSCTITSTTADFTASSETGGIVNRAVAVGDRITVSHANEAGNEGYQCDVTAVSAHSISGDDVSGAAAAESAGADINIVATKKTYQFLEAGGLSFVDGVQGLVFASWCVDRWNINDLDKYASMFTSIEPRAKAMANKDGWEPHDSDTLNAIRDSALEIRPDATSAYTKSYALLRTTGNLHEITDQITVWPDTDAWDTAPADAVMTGYLNQLFLVHDVPNAIDNRGSWFTRCAEPGKTIIMQEHDLQYAEIYPVSANNALDPKLSDDAGTPYHTDVEIAAAPYTNILYNSDVDGIYSGDVGGTPYDFYGYVDGDSKTHEQIHEKVNYLLRQPTDINNDGTGASMRGDKQWPKAAFSGDVFTVQCYLLNYPAAQRNNLRVVDTGDVVRKWPVSSSLTVSLPAILVGGEFTIYHKNTFGASDATVLQNESSVPQQDITITGSDGIVIAYSTYNVDGHTPNTPIECVLAWNRPGYVEPGNMDVTITEDNQTVTISPIVDPSYTAA